MKTHLYYYKHLCYYKHRGYDKTTELAVCLRIWIARLTWDPARNLSGWILDDSKMS